jgi:hypothetical protein
MRDEARAALNMPESTPAADRYTGAMAAGARRESRARFG